MTFGHSLRVSEATGMLWTDLDLRRLIVHVRRLKGSKDSVQTLKADEIAGLEALRAMCTSPYVFVSQRGARLSSGFVQLLVRECGERARIGLHCHPHMLRHSCGHAFADGGVDTRRIQEFPGRQDIRHTTRYTELAASRMADMVLD